jgi:hypothetical protein
MSMMLRLGLMMACLLVSIPAWPATRLGLFHTAEELEVWRQRALNGPYRVAGDVNSFTPGDWTRIDSNKNWYMTGSNHLATGTGDTASIWTGYTGSGCVPPDFTSISPLETAKRLRDAAFWALIKADAAVAERVRLSLMNQLSQTGTDFSNTSKWCVADGQRVGSRQPSFPASEWLMRILLAYDYVKDYIGATDRTAIDAWFLAAGTYFRLNSKSFIDTNYGTEANFLNGTLSSNGVTNSNSFELECCTDRSFGRTHVGGYRFTFLSSWHDNRYGVQVRAVGLVGVFLNNATLTDFAVAWGKSFIKYVIYPTGELGELYRSWTEGWNGTTHAANLGEEAGYSYSLASFTYVLDVAVALARTGDTTLMEYSTSVGGGDTVGGPKSLLTSALWVAGIDTGTVVRYRYDFAQTANNLIDGVAVNEGIGFYAYDVWLAHANGYWRHPTIKNAYLIPGATNKQGQTTVRSSEYAWMGAGQSMPGRLFLFAENDTEGPLKLSDVDPYNLTVDDVIPNPPTGFTVACATTSCTLNATKAAENTDESTYDDPGGYTINYCHTTVGCDPKSVGASIIEVDDTDDLVDYVVPGLLSSTLYRFTIRSRDVNGNRSAFFATDQEDTTDAPPPPTLVLHYTCDDADISGSTILDSTAFSHDGTISGSMTTETGVLGQACVFDGVDDHIRVPRTTDLEPAAFTVCAWVKPNGAQTQYASLFDKTWQNGAAPTYSSYAAYFNDSGTSPAQLSFTHGFSGNFGNLNSNTNALPSSSEFVHLCTRYNPAAVSQKKDLFLAGNLDTAPATVTDTIVYDTTATGDLWIGSGPNGDFRFKGSIDDLRIYDGAISEQLIAQLALGIPGTPTLAQESACWRRIDGPTGARCQAPPGQPGRLVKGNQLQFLTLIGNSGENSSSVALRPYCRSPAGTGATDDWWPIEGDCIGKKLCFGFSRSPTYTSGTPTQPHGQVTVGGKAFANGGRFYEAGSTPAMDILSIGADQFVLLEYVLRARSDVAVGTTFGCTVRYGSGTLLEGNPSESVLTIVHPTGFGG